MVAKDDHRNHVAGSWLIGSDANVGASGEVKAPPPRGGRVTLVSAVGGARLESSLIKLGQNEDTQQDCACFGDASRSVTRSWQEAALF